MNRSHLGRLVGACAGGVLMLGAGILLAFRITPMPAFGFCVGVLCLWYAATGQAGLRLLGRAIIWPVRAIRHWRRRKRESMARRRIERAQAAVVAASREQASPMAQAETSRIASVALRRTQRFECRTIIAGCNHPNADGSSRLKPLGELSGGEQLILAREIGNPHDRYAVRVYDSRSRQLGYVCHTWCREVHKKLAAEMVLDCRVVALKFDDGPPRAIIDIQEVDRNSAEAQRVLERQAAWKP